MDIPICWPEPVISVQSLADGGIKSIPQRYVKPPPERPSLEYVSAQSSDDIPLIDLGGLKQKEERDKIISQISDACKDWGFFKISNHGVDPDLLRRMIDVWQQFFRLPLSAKHVYANTPQTYEGYGSRLGVEKEAILDWGDYFFLIYLPENHRNREKWPAIPSECRATINEYAGKLVELSDCLMEMLSASLGLENRRLHEALGGKEGVSATLRINLYPKCPDPELTLGLSAHSDPGILTILLCDERVKGLQIHHHGKWVTVDPVPGTFIVNIGDQMQVITNGLYKSLEHRVVVSPELERFSIAFFCNPSGDLILGPLPELLKAGQPPLYAGMTFNEYRKFIRTKGPRGKKQIDSMKVL